jgi:hypothetical protein
MKRAARQGLPAILWVALWLASLAGARGLPPIQTVFVIVMENQAWSNIKGNTNAPYINNTLLPMASYCEGYFNVPGLHPSLPNYLWLEAGTNFGITDEDDPAVYHQNTTNHLVTLLKNAGVSWKAYQENVSGTNLPLTSNGAISARHNPFIYFDDVTGTNNPTDPYGLAHIRPYSEFHADLTNNTVARYTWLISDDCNDMHSICGPLTNLVRQGDTWLASEVPKILNSQAYKSGGALFITWDESYDLDTHIGMIILSPLAKGGGYSNGAYYTHSSALRTFQEIFDVGPWLGDAANATDLSDLFNAFGLSRVVKLPDGRVELTAVGVTPGRTNLVQASTDLSGWIPLTTNSVSTNTFIVIDDGATNLNRRFYRLVELP